jgi:subfamily B ATP-binding cassette protein MsbA
VTVPADTSTRTPVETTRRSPDTPGMPPFRTFARRMLRYRVAVFGAICFAFVSAGGLGAGLVSLGPLLEIILEGRDGATLRSLAENHAASGSFPPLPAALVSLLPTDPLAGVSVIMGGLLLLTVFGATANFLHQYLAGSVVARTIARVRLDAFRHVIALPMAQVVSRGPAELISRIVRDSAELQIGLMALLGRSVAQLTRGLAGLGAAIWFDWRLTLAAFLVAPPIGIVIRQFGRRIRRSTRGALRSQEDLLRACHESVQGLRGVKTATAEKSAMRRFNAANQRLLREELRIRTARALASPMVEALAVIVLAGLAILAAREILDGSLKLESFVLTLGSLGIAGASFKPLTALAHDIQAASAPAERLLDVLSMPAENREGRGLPALPRHRASIAFEGVRYRYPGADQEAIAGVDLEIAHGERVAIVGPNGCGKTTLVGMLPRLLEPSHGRITIDGLDIAEVNLRSLRRQIGVVTQEPVLLKGSIRENIVYGLSGVDESQVREAARLARAAEFIERLPQAYDTEVSEQGASLSGGQRQRIAIARAILRDPAILLLDEATSQVDAESEELINAALSDFAVGRTSILIAHRLSTVRSADRIVVMEAGRILDDGRHEALLDRCEPYVRLVRTQMVLA